MTLKTITDPILAPLGIGLDNLDDAIELLDGEQARLLILPEEKQHRAADLEDTYSVNVLVLPNIEGWALVGHRNAVYSDR